MADPKLERTPEEIAATVKKLEAEAAQAEAETKKALAEAREIEAKAAQQEITRAKAEHEESKRLAGDEHYRVYRFTSEVSSTSAKACMEQLAVWHRTDEGCDITIEFNSPGGDVIAGMALFDTIQETRRLGHKVTTSTKGMAASMAGILLQAGDVRIMAKESWLLIHEASFSVAGSYGDVEDRVRWIEMVQDRILNIFAARSQMTKAAIKRRWHRKDWWLSSDDALKLGFVDEIA